MSQAESGPIFALLSRLFLKEADAELLRELSRPDIADVLEALEPGFRSALEAAAASEAALEDLSVEYARLFLLPKGVSPYATAWMAGEEGAIRARLGDAISSLQDVLEVRPADFGLGAVPSDHIGMLLALTSVALQKEATGGVAAKCAALYAAWAPRFAADVVERSSSAFYRAAGRLFIEALATLTAPAP